MGAGSLPGCYCFLAGSPATSCATSLPANIIIVVSEDNRLESYTNSNVYHSNRIFTRQALQTFSVSPGDTFTADIL